VAKSIVLTFFLTLVLGLGESVSIQSMTVTIQALRGTRPTFAWYFRAFRRSEDRSGAGDAGVHGHFHVAVLFQFGSVVVMRNY
jgi:Mg/Co/Ni transporter MgtE